ncbi:MAG: hypothetical protein QM488_20545 [Rhizobiaceae bacterium]
MAFVYPSFQTKLSGEELITAPVYERINGGVWVPHMVTLKEANNPIKVRLKGEFLPGSPYLGNSVSFKVKIAGQHGTLLDETVKMFVNFDDRRVEDTDGLEVYFSHTPLFIVNVPGDYAINVQMEGEVDFSLSKVVVTVLSNAIVPDTRFRISGIIAIAFGVILFVRCRKNGRNNKSPATETTPAQVDPPKSVEKPVKKKIRWGRNADLD